MHYTTLTFSLILIFFGCQQVEINSAKKETLVDDATPFNLKIQPNIEQPEYKDIWEYFVSQSIKNNNYMYIFYSDIF